MGFMHVENLYKNQTILLFKECYASEKIHGTSSHVAWNKKSEDDNQNITFFSGGASFQNFVSLFNKEDLIEKFKLLGHDEITIYGEAYGGKMQGMSATYGPNLKFVAFDVKIGESWLNVPNAEDVTLKMGLEFVHYKKISTDIASIDAERDAPSVQSERNGIIGPKHREGVVLRPLYECFDNKMERIISKHKGEQFSETKTKREITGEALEVLNKAEDIAVEWVTDMRLEHVLDKLSPNLEMKDIPLIMAAMYEDVIREAKGEIIESKDLRKAIGTKTAKMFKKKLEDSLYSEL